MQVKGMIRAGILGTMGYYIISFIMTTLITATDTVTTFFKTIVPIAVGFGVAWLMIDKSFSGGKGGY